MAQAPQKRAKLAHDNKQADRGDVAQRLFAPAKALALVEWPAGNAMALVELDAAGTRGLVATTFARKVQDGLVVSELACPAVYDQVSRARSVGLYREFAAAQALEVQA